MVETTHGILDCRSTFTEKSSESGISFLPYLEFFFVSELDFSGCKDLAMIKRDAVVCRWNRNAISDFDLFLGV